MLTSRSSARSEPSGSEQSPDSPHSANVALAHGSHAYAHSPAACQLSCAVARVKRVRRTTVAPGVARGGSFSSRPKDATSSFRETFHVWQKVHDVGFRVLLEAVPEK